MSYECFAGFPFDPFRFEPGEAERGTDGPSEALREILGSVDGELLPRSGWRQVGETDSSVAFVAQDSNGHFYDARVEDEGDEWGPSGWGECTPELAVGDVNIVEWALDPEKPAPEPGDAVIHALINEIACHSFTNPLKRMREPMVSYEGEDTFIVLTADPLGGAQTCPGTPWVEFDIELEEPLQSDSLYDASTYPPRRADREPGF